MRLITLLHSGSHAVNQCWDVRTGKTKIPTVNHSTSTKEQDLSLRHKSQKLRKYDRVRKAFWSLSQPGPQQIGHPPEPLLKPHARCGRAGLDEPDPVPTRPPQVQAQTELCRAQSSREVLLVGQDNERDSPETLAPQHLGRGKSSSVQSQTNVLVELTAQSCVVFNLKVEYVRFSEILSSLKPLNSNTRSMNYLQIKRLYSNATNSTRWFILRFAHRPVGLWVYAPQ